MKYNTVIETNVDADLETEPVSLDELKAHLNMTFDTTGSYDFSDDDSYLQTLIMTARQSLEQYTGLSFGAKTISAVLRNECGNIEMPFGPILTITSVKDYQGNALAENTGYKVTGLNFKKLKSPCSDYIEMVYTAGYDVIPEPLKRAIKEEAAYRYKNRGEQGIERIDFRPGVCEGAMEMAAPYKRTSFIA